MKNLLGTLFLALILSGCAGPKYTASPISEESNADIVIVKNNKTDSDFQDSIESWLVKHDQKFISVPEGTEQELDKITLKYKGSWGWDFSSYLAKGEINAYQNGERVGVVNFKASDTLNGQKFGNVEKRIGYMMDILFRRLSVTDANIIINTYVKKPKKEDVNNNSSHFEL